MSLKIVHDLSKLSQEQLTQYLRDVSEYIGLDPSMGLLDTIWMQNENGVGQSLVVYARRGTAEILRDIHGINVESLTEVVVNGSIVFTATGTNKKGRREVAKGAKFIDGQYGKQLDNSIMSASTRTLRRLTMQFTGLGILDESEVHAVEPNLANPAAAVSLAPAAPLPTVQPSSAPGKVVELPPAFDVAAPSVASPAASVRNFATHQTEFIAEAHAQLDAKAALPPAVAAVKPAESAPSTEPKAARKPRKARNAVSLGDVEPETVSQDSAGELGRVSSPQQTAVAPATPQPDASPTPVSAQVNVAAPSQVNPADFSGKPNDVQMAEYRKKVSVFTAELPSSENMGSVQKMRAFITHMSGTTPQFMTTDQWSETLAWFDSFVERNKMKGLVTYINDALGVK